MSWTFVLLCYATMLYSFGVVNLENASPLNVPLWVLNRGLMAILNIVFIGSLIAVIILGFIYFTWWGIILSLILGAIISAFTVNIIGPIFTFFISIPLWIISIILFIYVA